MTEVEETKDYGYLGWAYSLAKDYARNSNSVSYVYGKLRGLAQPWISTNFNVHQIEEGVYIGDLASASNYEKLKEHGITHIITAVLGVSPQFPKDFTYLTVPIKDVETEDIRPYLGQTTSFIDNALASGGKVFVHCMCGVSRSASIVAAWLMTKRGEDDIIQFIRNKRGCVDPNIGFRDQLKEYKLETRM